MPRCWKCGSPDLAPLLGDSYQCNECGQVTNMATRRGPAEGLHSNNDMLGSVCMDFMKAHHPDEYRMLADTVAGQPDPGTAPGGAPLTNPTPEPVVPEPVAPEPQYEPAPEPEQRSQLDPAAWHG